MSGLEEMIASCRRLGGDFDAEVAKAAARRLEESVQATANAGASPHGQAWAPRKAGGRAMANAAAHVSAKAFGPVLRMTLEGPDVFHHFGAKGAPRRPVIPDSGGAVPAVVARAVDEAGAEVFGRITGGR